MQILEAQNASKLVNAQEYGVLINMHFFDTYQFISIYSTRFWEQLHFTIMRLFQVGQLHVNVSSKHIKLMTNTHAHTLINTCNTVTVNLLSIMHGLSRPENRTHAHTQLFRKTYA